MKGFYKTAHYPSVICANALEMALRYGVSLFYKNEQQREQSQPKLKCKPY
ncbi:hypothetical protein C723_1781 [Christiangramia flava JLT2011]|nr:hypothetical protein C723_1781 [Christiangramia flava JLT2011]